MAIEEFALVTLLLFWIYVIFVSCATIQKLNSMREEQEGLL